MGETAVIESSDELYDLVHYLRYRTHNRNKAYTLGDELLSDNLGEDGELQTLSMIGTQHALLFLNALYTSLKKDNLAITEDWPDVLIPTYYFKLNTYGVNLPKVRHELNNTQRFLKPPSGDNYFVTHEGSEHNMLTYLIEQTYQLLEVFVGSGDFALVQLVHTLIRIEQYKGLTMQSQVVFPMGEFEEAFINYLMG